jgi:hypothetical protein
MKKSTRILLGIFMLLVFAILIAGCRSGISPALKGEVSAVPGQQYDEQATMDVIRSRNTVGKGESPGVPGTNQPRYDWSNKVKDKRKVITTATLAIQVKSLDKAKNALTETAVKSGGYVNDSSVQTLEGGEKSGTVVLKIPEQRSDDVMKEIRLIGTVLSEDMKGQDVTEEYTDLNSRLRNLTKEENRLLDILNMGKTVTDVLQVERELARVRGEIESITGRVKMIDSLAAYVTITINLTEKGQLAHAPNFWNTNETVIAAWSAFLSTIRALLGVLIWLAIFSPLAIAFIVLWHVRKRIRARRLKKNG